MMALKQQTRCKEEFVNRILAIGKHEKKEDHFNIMTKATYDSLVHEIQEAQLASKKTQKQYRRLNRFKVININGKQALVTNKEPMKYYLYVDEIFDVIEEAHEALGHGGRDKVKIETSRKYANITIEMINIFLSLCETCQRKKNVKNKEYFSEPILHSAMKSRCQVDLIDMQTQEDCGFKFIMVYQDLLTKYVVLRALRSDRAVEVADQLADIFLTFGAPCILHSDNGKDFVKSVINELALFWPECKLVQGNNSHSQVPVERINKDIEILLDSWMQENNTKNWSKGIRFIQYQKNMTFNSSIKQSPYKAMFGVEQRVGIMTTNLPPDIIKDLRDETDLENALNKMNIADTDNVKPEPVTKYIKPSPTTTAAKQKDPEDSSSSNGQLLIKDEPSECENEAVDPLIIVPPKVLANDKNLGAPANVKRQIQTEIEILPVRETAHKNLEKHVKRRKL